MLSTNTPTRPMLRRFLLCSAAGIVLAPAPLVAQSTSSTGQANSASIASTAVQPNPVQQAAPQAAAMPDADEVSARGGVAALHLDLHVYVEQPQQRFIFVNSRKYKEGDTLAEGPLVEQITPDGAVLNFRGSRFKLSND